MGGSPAIPARGETDGNPTVAWRVQPLPSRFTTFAIPKRDFTRNPARP